MSEYPAAVYAAAQQARVERQRVESDGTRLLVAMLLASVIAAYAVVVGAIYLLVTSVSGPLLVAGGVHTVFLYSVLLVVMQLRTKRGEQRAAAREMNAQLNGPTPRYRATWRPRHTWMGVSK